MSRKPSKTLEIAQRSLREGRLEGIIDAPKSGRWGNWEYYMLGKTQCCRRHVERRKSRTAAQGKARDAMGSAAKAWRTKLTQEQRDAWNEAAKHLKSRRRLVPSGGPLLGEQLFVRHYTVLEEAGKEMPLWPAQRPVFPPNPVAALSITYGSDGVRITLRVGGPVTEDIIVSGQAPCSAGRKQWRRGAILCLLPAGEAGERDITADYVGRFGEPEPGRKVFIRVQQQRDGWKDFEADLSEVVPAKAEAGGRQEAAEGSEAALGEAGRSNGLSKMPEIKGLRGFHGLRGARAGGQPAGGSGVRYTRGWFRVGSVSIPCQYRRGERGRWQMANAKWHKSVGGVSGEWQNEGAAGRRRRGHWRELWRGS